MTDEKQLAEKTLEELIALVTDPKKRTYLKLLSELHYNSKVTDAMKIGAGTPYGWMIRDSVFNEAYEAVKKEEDKYWLGFHLQTIRNIVSDPATPPQTRLLGSFFEVKKLDPSYRDNPPEYLTQVGNMVVHLNIPDRDYLPASSITVEARELPEGKGDATKQGDEIGSV